MDFIFMVNLTLDLPDDEEHNILSARIRDGYIKFAKIYSMD